MNATEIKKYVDTGFVHVVSNGMTLFGKFVGVNQSAALQAVNKWIFTVGNDSTELDGKSITSIS